MDEGKSYCEEDVQNDPRKQGMVMAQECTPTTTEVKIHTEHQTIRCACGCVPNVLSLFEMAALRAARKKQQKNSTT